ncbi:MAG: hypothetical protein IJD41_01815 [Alphaproteobacteria bacterium]|nr:hypothetical protein [Alphaproteobacteria bacterium]
MKKVLIFVALCLGLTDGTYGAVRDGGVATRAKNGTTNTTQRLTNSTKSARTAARTSTLTPRNTATTTKSATTRATTARATTNNAARTATARATTQNQSPVPRVIARATTTDTVDLTQTRTGAEYERCKTAYFTCMDQFCGQKNDDYRRCSCSNRVYDLVDAREILTQAGEQLTVFTENLDVVGMTAAQATAMKTASDGEKALTDDKSASKALLQAILNSIRGKDSSVGGKFSDLNSINISFDTANAFGTMDAGQAIATYNGQNLYSAVYPQCRAAVRADCNDASLQRAITAYLMAIEQDCNTVETAIENKRKEMKSAIREGSAMLDLARVENRQKHNSSDIATCIAEVESAILSEQVCGAGYHKCLDNGEFIDISTGAPIAGVTNFYQLTEMLKFADGVDAANQKLSKNTANRTFVQNFESRTKKFAADALDKCVEDADIVWSEYLDQALLDIYYAQRAKVDIIKQGCFDFVSTCYMNADGSMTDAMKELTGDSGLGLQPSKITLTGAMCTDYVNSCNSLFKTDIIKDYITERQETDTLTACRAVAKQCFDSFGGANYENFYYPYSGLFTPNTGTAPDWFTLYEYISDDTYSKKSNINDTTNYDPTYTEFVEHNGKYRRYKSTCAKQLTAIDSCNSPEMIEAAFGGFDKMYVESPSDDTATTFNTSGNGTCDYEFTGEKTATSTEKYGIMDEEDCLSHRIVRPTGVATEIYNQVIDILTTQCTNLQGRFMELQYGRLNQYMPDNICLSNFKFPDDGSGDIIKRLYVVGTNENMCPRDYALTVDTKSWGACLCWENGGRRSKNGTSAKCLAAIPVAKDAKDTRCSFDFLNTTGWQINDPDAFNTLVFDTNAWCIRDVYSSKKQVCPITFDDGDEVTSYTECDTVIGGQNDLPDGLSM